MSAWFWLMLCFLVRSSEAQVNIRAKLGQDVILPCRAPNNNKPIRAVEWIRPELDTEHVLLYRYGRLYPDHQHPSYRNRVDLQDRQMKDGNVSLVLKDVKMEDTGTYECRVFLEGTKGLTKEPTNIIYLLVHQLGGKDGIIAGSARAQVNITAKSGQDVTLPCRAPNNNKTVTGVQWSRPEVEPRGVLLYQGTKLYPDYQHPSYRNRVDLQDRQMKDGNASLVLKDVTMNDTGTYECHVSQKETNRRKRSVLGGEPIRIIHLEVLEEGDTEGGDQHKGDKVGITRGYFGSVVSVILAVILLAGGFLIYKRLKRQKSHRPVPPDEPAAIEMSPVPESAAEPSRASGTSSSTVEMMEPAAAEQTVNEDRTE